MNRIATRCRAGRQRVWAPYTRGKPLADVGIGCTSTGGGVVAGNHAKAVDLALRGWVNAIGGRLLDTFIVGPANCGFDGLAAFGVKHTVHLAADGGVNGNFLNNRTLAD